MIEGIFIAWINNILELINDPSFIFDILIFHSCTFLAKITVSNHYSLATCSAKVGNTAVNFLYILNLFLKQQEHSSFYWVVLTTEQT